MPCARCLNRITLQKAMENRGYCELCIASIGRQLIQTRQQEVMLLDVSWRESVVSSLIMILNQLRDANFPEPWYGLTPKTQQLAHNLGVEQNPWINDDAPEIDGETWTREERQQIGIEDIEELIY